MADVAAADIDRDVVDDAAALIEDEVARLERARGGLEVARADHLAVLGARRAGDGDARLSVRVGGEAGAIHGHAGDAGAQIVFDAELRLCRGHDGGAGRCAQASGAGIAAAAAGGAAAIAGVAAVTGVTAVAGVSRIASVAGVAGVAVVAVVALGTLLLLLLLLRLLLGLELGLLARRLGLALGLEGGLQLAGETVDIGLGLGAGLLELALARLLLLEEGFELLLLLGEGLLLIVQRGDESVDLFDLGVVLIGDLVRVEQAGSQLIEAAGGQDEVEQGEVSPLVGLGRRHGEVRLGDGNLLLAFLDLRLERRDLARGLLELELGVLDGRRGELEAMAQVIELRAGRRELGLELLRRVVSICGHRSQRRGEGHEAREHGYGDGTAKCRGTFRLHVALLCRSFGVSYICMHSISSRSRRQGLFGPSCKD